MQQFTLSFIPSITLSKNPKRFIKNLQIEFLEIINLSDFTKDKVMERWKIPIVNKPYGYGVILREQNLF